MTVLGNKLEELFDANAIELHRRAITINRIFISPRFDINSLIEKFLIRSISSWDYEENPKSLINGIRNSHKKLQIHKIMAGLLNLFTLKES
jgi:hypothetical protein